MDMTLSAMTVIELSRSDTCPNGRRNERARNTTAAFSKPLKKHVVSANRRNRSQHFIVLNDQKTATNLHAKNVIRSMSRITLNVSRTLLKSSLRKKYVTLVRSCSQLPLLTEVFALQMGSTSIAKPAIMQNNEPISPGQLLENAERNGTGNIRNIQMCERRGLSKTANIFNFFNIINTPSFISTTRYRISLHLKIIEKTWSIRES